MYDWRAIYVLRVIWYVEIDGGIHFQIWPEEMSRTDQISKTKLSCKKNVSLLSISVSGIWKKCHLLWHTAIGNDKNYVWKSSIISLTFSGIIEPKINRLPSIFACLFWYIYWLHNIYSCLVKFKMLALIGICEKSKFLFLGVKKSGKIDGTILYEHSVLRIFVFFFLVYFLLQNWVF